MAVSKVELANGDVLIDLTNDTVKPETLAEGVTAHGADGEPIVGTMRSAEDLNEVLTEQEALIAQLQDTLRGKAAGGGASVETCTCLFLSESSFKYNVYYTDETITLRKETFEYGEEKHLVLLKNAYFILTRASQNTTTTTYVGGDVVPLLNSTRDFILRPLKSESLVYLED